MTDDLEFDTAADRPGYLLFVDVETTGFPDFKLAADDASQHRICSVAALVTNDVGKIINSFASLIKPDNWPEMDLGAATVHGLTPEYCDQFGLPGAVVFVVIEAMLAQAERRVGHNIAFDLKMLRGELRRLELPDHYNKELDYCTMHNSRAICQIPNANGKGTKVPKLAEAHQHFFGKPIVNAHTALADVNACKRIYFAINPVTEP